MLCLITVFQNLISGLGNFFSEIAIVNLLETRAVNSTLPSSNSSLSFFPITSSPFYSSRHDSFSPNNLLSKFDMLYKISQKDVDIPDADFTHEGASGTAISGVFIALLLPGIFLMPVTGIVADLFDRRKILLASDIARGFIVLLFPVAYFIQGLEWLVYLTIFLQYCFGAFFEPSREALVPLAVKQKDLPIANALDSLCWLAVSFFGSSLGGLVVSVLGIPANFAFDSASFFISGFFCLLLFKYKHLGRRGIDDRNVETHLESKKDSVELDENAVNNNGNPLMPSSPPRMESSLSNSPSTTEETILSQHAVIHSSTEMLHSRDDMNEITDASPNIELKEERNIMLNRKMQQDSNMDDSPIVSDSLVTTSHVKSTNSLILLFIEMKKYFIELFRGIVFFSKNPLIFTSTMVKAFAGFFWFGCEIILIHLVYQVLAVNDRRMGGIYFGVAKMWAGIGSGLFPVIVERLLPKTYTTLTLRAILMCAVFLFPVCFALYYVSVKFAVEEETRILGFAGICLSHLILGISTGNLWSYSITHLQMVCPNDFLGRAMALDIGFFLNISNLIAVFTYGVILTDIFKFSANHMILFELVTSIGACCLFAAWFFIFRKNVKSRQDYLKEMDSESSEVQEENFPSSSQENMTA